jgi:tetratricopeptide (TPR) repeat protein
MAKIRHPNVIVVHEVGTVGERVYVAMEFADGGTLRAWLAAAPCTTREIIDVFAQAGRGLAAAHAAGLVHRDFKPDNVLLSSDGTARVTDFGLVGVLSEETVAPASYAAPVDTGPTPLQANLTQTGAIMGTPRYMAPEQFRGEPTTDRTDQFAFCVALYEALYGERPFAGTSYAELCANVTTGSVQPPPKSARVPARIRRVLLRGLALAPGDRYPSMKALLAALARDQTRARAVLAGGALAVCLAAAAGAFALRPSKSAECGDGAEHVQPVWNPARRAAMQQAFAASHRADAATVFTRSVGLVDAWTAAWQDGYTGACRATRATIDLAITGGANVVVHAVDAFAALPSVADCADQGALLARVAPPANAIVRAQVMAVDGHLAGARAAVALGTIGQAVEHAKAAVGAAKTSGYAPVIAHAEQVLAYTQRVAGDTEQSVAIARDAVHVAATTGDEELLLATAGDLVEALLQRGDALDRADEIGGLADARAKHTAHAADDEADLAQTLAYLDYNLGRFKRAQDRLERSRVRAEKELGRSHPMTLQTLAMLAMVYRDEGKLDEARTLYESVLARQEQLFGRDHPANARVLNQLGSVLRTKGDYDGAVKVYERALAIERAVYGSGHYTEGETLTSLGNVASERLDHAAALGYFAQAQAVFEKSYSAQSTWMEPVLLGRAIELEATGKRAEARADLMRALDLVEKAQGHDSPRELDIYNNLAVLDVNDNKLAEAADAYDHARRIAVAKSGPDSGDVVDIDINVSDLLKNRKQYREAVALLDGAKVACEKAYGADHPRMAMLLANRAESQGLLGNHREALADLEQARAIFAAKLGPEHDYVKLVTARIAAEQAALRRSHR